MLIPTVVTDQMADGASRVGFCKLSAALWHFGEAEVLLFQEAAAVLSHS